MTRAELIHKDKLAQLGCLACLRIYGPHNPGPVELHHLRTGGWGKGDYKTLIPLCVEHHRGKRGIHGLGTKAFDAEYPFTQRDLLDDALRLIGATA
ncbi:Ref family recombination enhancement nuclease [Polaromonas sp. YR568]|uniref:Ref family recombination enhancement nuclease n=1 Tax=Polaromonas sp. YR568 TaxID=1855301 RepID=UPI00313774EA